MNRLVWLCLMGMSPLFATNPSEHPRVVTYETTSGRFADNLISYIHARYIAYQSQLPLLYSPFVYSNELKLSQGAILLTDEMKKNYKRQVRLSSFRLPRSQDGAGTMYLVPYFPDSEWERENCISYQGGRWEVLPMDWEDEGFMQEIRSLVQTKRTLTFPEKPRDRISVAAHLRRGGNYDDAQVVRDFPLKFISTVEVIKELRMLRETLREEPLYVYLFTDDSNPMRLKREFEREFADADIQFDCRTEGNSESSNVLYDFFHMMEFDCLLYSDSNFSYAPFRLGKYLATIAPRTFKREAGGFSYPTHWRTLNRSHPKFREGYRL
ncbi:MAG: hypothetical protein S4CHLAM102_06400 [Chlamydiia bacterium]|nr:hypothetical protein [Chlamydiia bacterium]